MNLDPTALQKRDRIFYTGLAAIFTATVFVGFARTYYLKTFFGTPGLSMLAHVHGLFFTLWVLLFLAQTLLIAAGRTDLHRRIGITGAFLAAGLVVLGTVMTVMSVRLGYSAGRPHMDVLFVNALVDLVLFSVFFGAGIYFRQRKEMHKRLMALSMVAIVFPAFIRLPSAMSYIVWLINGFALVGIIYDVIFLRRIYFTNVAGAALILLTTPLRFAIAATPGWHAFVMWVVR